MDVQDKKAMQNFKENPNPNAKIGFVICYPIHFYFLKDIYKHVADKAEFIIDEGRFFPIQQPQQIFEDAVALAKRHGVKYRVLKIENYTDQKRQEEFFSRYDILVALWWTGCLRLPCTKAIKKVFINYGAGKELAMFRTSFRHWDLYLCFGQYMDRVMRLLTRTEIVGYPKFDDWFNNAVDAMAIVTIKKKLDPKKKSILFLPTHGDLSSINEITEELKKSSSQYNILVKFHYYTPYETPELVKGLEHPGITIFGDADDLLPLLKIADVVISDNSSSIFDAILADKPVVLTDFLSKAYLDLAHKKIKNYKYRGPDMGLTYSQSIDQRIKSAGQVVVLSSPLLLISAIEEAIRDPEKYQIGRKKIRDELFSFQDGQCGKRAANALKILLEERTSPEKPVLYHVLESETAGRHKEWLYYKDEELDAENASGLRSQKNKSNQFEEQIKKIKSLPFFKKIEVILRMF